MRRRTARSWIGVAACTLLAAVANAADVVDIRQLAGDRIAALEQHIGERDVLFYAVDSETGAHFAYQPSRAAERHVPYSTFKIPNLVIALETGVATSLAHERVWDERRRPAASYWPPSWQQNQTLESAFRRSAAWYFQDVAVEVGGERYRRYLRDFGYGNAAAPDSNDAFWLEGPLGVSPSEQALFLEQLITEQLGVSRETLDALRDVSLLGDFAGYRLHGKTGSGPVVLDDFDGAFEGWLVGWVDRPQAKPLTYALYTRGENYSAIEAFRGEMSAQFLQLIDALPER